MLSRFVKRNGAVLLIVLMFIPTGQVPPITAICIMQFLHRVFG